MSGPVTSVARVDVQIFLKDPVYMVFCVTVVIQKETVNVLMTVLVSRLTVFNKASYRFEIFGLHLIPSKLVSLHICCAWIY